MPMARWIFQSLPRVVSWPLLLPSLAPSRAPPLRGHFVICNLFIVQTDFMTQDPEVFHWKMERGSTSLHAYRAAEFVCVIMWQLSMLSGGGNGWELRFET